MAAPECFALLAELPLGVYVGRDAAGGVDVLPAPARLHAALVAAAAQGPRAVPDGPGMQPSEEDRVVLRWIEGHPPDGVVIPAYRRSDADVTVYRKLGLLKKDVFDGQILGKHDHRSVAVAGPLAWTWDGPPPVEVVRSLELLVPDVSHLGTSETPVRLWVGAARPTHRRDPAADLFATDGVDLDIATPGRLDALEAAYRATARTPTVKADEVKGTEDDLVPVAVRTARTAARYVELDVDPVPDGPWEAAVMCELDGPVIAPSWSVAWAVAMHRALVATIGTGAPPVLTGAYGEGLPRPANRVAIHLLSGAVASVLGLDASRTTVVVALPRGMDAVASARVVAAATSMRTLTRGNARRKVTPAGILSGSRFWPRPAGGGDRRWATSPVAVPDTRPLRHQPWTLADAAALSVALVFRDEWAPVGDRGDARYRRLADAAVERGVEVLSARRLTDSRVGRWVHRGHEGVVVQPYRAEVRLGDLSGDRALVAIGQSRHLGGGLLVPTDLVDPWGTSGVNPDDAAGSDDDAAETL